MIKLFVDLVSKRTTELLIDKNIISDSDNEIYVYGLQLLIATILKITGLFMIALFLGCIKEFIVFLAAFSILRVFAGGYHAQTYLKCFTVTAASMFSIIGLGRYIPSDISINLIVILMISSICLVAKYAPIDNPNKRLTDKEYKAFKKISILIVIIETIVILMSAVFYKESISYCIIASMAIFLECITLTPLISSSKH